MSTELAWAAGFFDGEGCISRKRAASSRSCSFSVSQNGFECLLRFRAALGLGKIYSSPGKVNQLMIMRLSDVDMALTLLWPYLSGPKKKQAQRTGFVFGHIRSVAVGRPKRRA